MTGSPTPDAYGDFAAVYDRSLGKHFLSGVRQVLERLLQKYPTEELTHLDLACGTGLAIEFLQKQGFDSTGFDASISMLRLARTRGRRIFAGDFRDLSLRATFGRVTCLYDSLNHLVVPEELEAAFRSARAVMHGSSLFWFDLNHPEVYPRVWGMRDPYVSSGSDYFLTIATSYRKEDRLGIGNIHGWYKEGSRRMWIRERHYQRPYYEGEVRTLLGRAGLEIVEIIPFDPFAKDVFAGDPVKLFFVARPS